MPKERISKFFAPNTSSQKIEETIVKALEELRQRERNRNRDAREIFLCNEIELRSVDIKDKLRLEREDKRHLQAEKPARHSQQRKAQNK